MSSLTLDETTWANVVAETKAGIERLNAKAREYGTDYRFTVEETDPGGGTHDAICTTQYDGGMQIRQVIIARSMRTGEVCTVKRIKGRGYTDKRSGYTETRSKPAPKKWAALSGKPAAEVVREFGLLSYRMILSATMTSVRSEKVA